MMGFRHYSAGWMPGARLMKVKLLPPSLRCNLSSKMCIRDRVGTPFFGEAAARASEYWQIIMGPLLLLVVLFARRGIDGLLAKLGAKVSA